MNTLAIKWLKFGIKICVPLFIFTGCYTMKPYGTLSTPDSNQRVLVENAQFVKERNALGLSLNIGFVSACGFYGYKSEWTFKENGVEKPPNKYINAAVGTIGGILLTSLINSIGHKNESFQVKNPSEWINKYDKNFMVYKEQGESFMIIDKNAEKEFVSKNLQDFYEFNSVFPNSPYFDDVFKRSHNQIPKNDIPKLLTIYPNTVHLKDYQMEYLNQCNTIDDCVTAKNFFREIFDEADKKASSMVKTWEDFEKYYSGFRESRNINNVICSFYNNAGQFDNKKKADLYEKILSKKLEINCTDEIKSELDKLYYINLESSNIEQLKIYVSNYPQSKLTPLAINKIRVDNEKIKMEYNLYRSALHDYNSCLKYLEEYPNGKYKFEIATIKEKYEYQIVNKQPDNANLNSQNPNVKTQLVNNTKIAPFELYQKFANDAINGSLSELKEFVEDGYSLNPPNDFGYTVLTGVVNYSPYRSHVLTYLLGNGADPNYINENFTTALSYAINKNNIEATKILLEHGANPNHREHPKNDFPEGLPMLEKALMSATDNTEIIELLINSGAEVNNTLTKSDYGKFTTLGIAIDSKFDKKITKLLIDAGADVNGKMIFFNRNTSETVTLLEFAENKDQNSEIVNLLRTNGAEQMKTINSAKKYITIGDICNLFSSKSNVKPSEHKNSETVVVKQQNDNQKTIGPSMEDIENGLIEIPSYKNNDYQKGGSLTLGDFLYSHFEFKDGVSGTLFKGDSSKKFYISVDGITPIYYKTESDAIKALYIYKKYNEITIIGKE